MAMKINDRRKVRVRPEALFPSDLMSKPTRNTVST